MDKNLFDDLTASLQEAIDIKQGRRAAARRSEYLEPSPRAVRDKLGLSQEKFALLIGVSKRTVEKWEQNVARPSGAARSLLIIANEHPQMVFETLHQPLETGP